MYSKVRQKKQFRLELVIGEPLAALQNEAEAILSDETAFKAWLNELSQETLTYAEASKVIKKK
jgi:CRISPR-associated protein Csc2